MNLIFPILYISAGVFSLMVSFIVYNSYLGSKNKGLLYLSLAFTFLFFHAISLSIPSILNQNDLRLVAWGYVLGAFFVFLILASCVKVQESIVPSFKKYTQIFFVVIGVVGITTVSLLIYDFRLPTISHYGVILWNTTNIASWLLGGASFIYGLIWSYTFYQGGGLLSGNKKKVKMFVLSIDGLFIGTAGLLVFTSENTLQTFIGASLFLTASFITALALGVSKWK